MRSNRHWSSVPKRWLVIGLALLGSALLWSRVVYPVQLNAALLSWLPHLEYPRNTLPSQTASRLKAMFISALGRGGKFTGSAGVQLGAVLYRAGDEREAISIWAEAGAAPYLLDLGRVYRARGLPALAERLYVAAAEVEPRSGPRILRDGAPVCTAWAVQTEPSPHMVCPWREHFSMTTWSAVATS